MKFNIWSPTRLADNEIRFDVTVANAPGLASGDPDWVAACLEILDVDAPAQEWSIQPVRCHFYSDTYDLPHWEDRWLETWIVRVNIDGIAPTSFGPPEDIPRHVNKYDETWSEDKQPEHDDCALVIMLRHGFREATVSALDRFGEFTQTVGRVTERSVESVGPEWNRLRLRIEGSVFPNHLTTLEEVVQRGSELGFVVNRNELIGHEDID